jgi:hypothetical protein
VARPQAVLWSRENLCLGVVREETAGVEGYIYHAHIVFFVSSTQSDLIYPINHQTYIMSGKFQALEDVFGHHRSMDPIEVRSHPGGGLSVGASGSLVRTKVPEPGYDNSATRGSPDKLLGGNTSQTLQIPSGHESVFVKNALESLNDTNLASLYANEESGRKAFVDHLRGSEERWANNPYMPTPRTGARTAKSESVAIYNARRPRPMALSTHEPTRTNDGPPTVSIRTEGGPGTGRPISILRISVEIPRIVESPKGTSQFTLTPDSLAGFVTSLVVLEPSIRHELKSLLADYSEETQAATEEAIGRMIEPDLKTLLEYGVREDELKRQSSDNPPESVQSGWRVQGVPGKPCLEATMRGE